MFKYIVFVIFLIAWGQILAQGSTNTACADRINTQECCRRTYSVCHKFTPTGTGYFHIELVGKERLKECSEQPKYNPRPCEDGC